jgi:hypothetical protein
MLMLLLASQAAFAGSYALNCSTADGKVRVAGDQIIFDDTAVGGQKTTKSVSITARNLVLWNNLGATEADVRLLAIGQASIISKNADNSCRETGDVTLVQQFQVMDMLAGRENRSGVVTLLCTESFATTTGGRDCSK